MQGQRVEALREFARLSRLKFDSGVAGYLEVLIADNELFAGELSAVSLRSRSTPNSSTSIGRWVAGGSISQTRSRLSRRISRRPSRCVDAARLQGGES